LAREASATTAELLGEELGWDAARVGDEAARFGAIERHDIASTASVAARPSTSAEA
jgi:hypothetical protein